MSPKTALTLLLIALAANQASPEPVVPGPPLVYPTEKDVYWYPDSVIDNLPKKINWGDHEDELGNRINYLTTMKNQHSPAYCGSCWAQSIVSHMSDRINIHIHFGTSPETTISPQMLVACAFDHAKRMNGCSGGDTWHGMKWIQDNFLYTSSCMPYTAEDTTCQQGYPLCSWVNKDGEFVEVDPELIPKYTFKEIRNLTIGFNQLETTLTRDEQLRIIKRNEKNMMAELQKGPIVCGVASTKLLGQLRGKEIWSNRRKYAYNHDISIVGYDDTGEQNYWIVRNSWGEPFGYEGYFNVLKGEGIIGIELLCRAGDPIVLLPGNPGFKRSFTRPIIDYKSERRVLSSVGGKEEKRASQLFDYVAQAYRHLKKALTSKKTAKGASVKITRDNKQISKTTLKSGLSLEMNKKHPKFEILESKPGFPTAQKLKLHATPNQTPLPKSLDYTYYQGQNIASWTVNQHYPRNCKSSHAIAALGALSDRINLKRIQDNIVGPGSKVTLSVQSLLNCGVGTCEDGGSTQTAYKFVFDKAAYPNGCNFYKAESPAPGDAVCDAMATCSQCLKDTTTSPVVCAPIEKPPEFGIKAYGKISGAEQMKREILNEGPIACEIFSTHGFFHYTGGVYSEYRDLLRKNYNVVIVGWDVDPSGVEYWIGRASYGTFWGEKGYFRLKMYEDNLGVEDICYWATPDREIQGR